MRLRLPAYQSVEHLDGTGNFAVEKYYKWPFRFFYQKKLKLILRMIGPAQRILDFGCGKARILSKELEARSQRVVYIENGDYIDFRWKFHYIVCASVLEFVDNLEETLSILRQVMDRGGYIIGATVCDNWATRLYFRLIGDVNKRRSHTIIRKRLHDYFNIIEEGTWFGLYYYFKGERRR